MPPLSFSVAMFSVTRRSRGDIGQSVKDRGKDKDKDSFCKEKSVNVSQNFSIVIRYICHFVDTSTILSSKFDTPKEDFLHQKSSKTHKFLNCWHQAEKLDTCTACGAKISGMKIIESWYIGIFLIISKIIDSDLILAHIIGDLKELSATLLI